MKLILTVFKGIKYKNLCVETEEDFKWIIDNIKDIDNNIILYFTNKSNKITDKIEKIKKDKEIFKKSWKQYLRKEKIKDNEYKFFTYMDKKQIFKKFDINKLNLNYPELFKNNIELTYNKPNKILKILQNARNCYDIEKYNNECYYINRIKNITIDGKLIKKTVLEQKYLNKLLENLTKKYELEIEIINDYDINKEIKKISNISDTNKIFYFLDKIELKEKYDNN